MVTGLIHIRPDILSDLIWIQSVCIGYEQTTLRVATVRENVLENEKCSRSGKSQGISFSVREI